VTRLDPFDFAFAPLAAERFPVIQEEARLTRKHSDDRAQFAMLSSVQRILSDVEEPEVVASDTAAAEAYLTTVYVAYRFWEAGRLMFSVSERDIEEVALEAAPDTFAEVPGGACYIQLPERWCWAQVDPEAPHEPLDGLFVVTGSHGEVTVLAVLGLRPDRPGFSEVTVVAQPADFVAAQLEARDPPFAPVVEGGEDAGLKSIVTDGEVLHLALLALLASQS